MERRVSALLHLTPTSPTQPSQRTEPVPAGLPLNYDRELQTVGFANFVSGCCGGYTGSYIFSQTIFNLRRGITDDARVCGWTIAFLEMVVVVAPVSVPSYLPKVRTPWPLPADRTLTHMFF